MAHLFFDLDGTLADPKPGITASVIAALTRLGLPAPDADALEWVIGPPLHESLARLGAPDPMAALAIYREVYGAGEMLNVAVYPGIPEALEAMCAAGHQLFLATAKPHVYATEITAHLGLDRWLQDQFGPEMDGTHSDKAELLAHAMARLGTERGAMIGDRAFDMAAGRANGLATIGAAWGYGTAEEMSAADVTCGGPGDLPGAVARLL